MEFIVYYKILGIMKSTTEADVKEAYHKITRKQDPDLNPNKTEAENKFKAVNKENNMLSDLKRKHTELKQVGSDFYGSVDINLYTAYLWRKVLIDAFNSKLSLKFFK